MDPLDPVYAQQIVVAYAHVLERDISEKRHPARVDSLPFAVSTIKTAIRTSVTQLGRTGQLTNDMRDYFETAYISLADYLDAELVTLVSEFRQSAEHLEKTPAAPEQRLKETAWRRLAESSALAGEIARVTASECEKLRSEFRTFLQESQL
jgi:hypothetical protein